ncbi:hypothetical protein H2203_000394 [Taxawa tesnikishii (nom. ined.)]|nr:hypothetical protein H2203_000394 [Dothideales sp. JES 119]
MPGSESHFGSRKPRDLSQDGGFLGAVSRFWQQSYAPDYLGLVILLAAYMLMQFLMEPFHRMFSLDDRRIQFPHAEVERVPVSWLFVPELHKAHVTMLGLLISLVLTSFVTDVIKNAVGRPRPDLIARCKPELDTPRNELVTFKVCTEKDHHVLHDGWRSFPSGHSSFAFSGLGYLGFFFISQMHVLRPRADLARVMIASAPFLGAMLIAISRLEDYRHDVFDVVIGSSLGFALAYFNWRRYYPALSSRQCATPHPSRADPSPNGAGFSRVRDEEEALNSARV